MVGPVGWSVPPAPRRDTDWRAGQPPLPGIPGAPLPRIGPRSPQFHQAHSEAVWGQLAHPRLQHLNPFLREADHDDDPDASGSASNWRNHGMGWEGSPPHEDDEKEWLERHERATAPSALSEHNHLRRITNRAQVVVAMRAHALDNVLHEGRLKSQFETNTSGGALAPASRAELEEKYFGYPHDLPPSARPIYGYLDHDPTREHFHASMYGDHRVVLKRPNVWHRTSATFGDSLDWGEKGLHSAHPVTDMHTSAYPSMHYLDSPRSYTHAGNDDILYTEAQIHGGVRRSDIHYVAMDHHDAATTAHLDHHGIPWVVTPHWGKASWSHHHARRTATMTDERPRASVVAYQPPDAWIISTGRRTDSGLALGRIVDAATGRAHAELPLDSLLARGYWVEPPEGAPSAENLLARVEGRA